MNPTQLQTTVAPIVTFVAGLLAGRNVFGWDLGTWSTIIGAVVALIATVWTAIKTSKTAIVTTVADMPEVKTVTLDAAAPGSAAIAQATPSNVTT